jgi:predicted nucleotidyltransferase
MPGESVQFSQTKHHRKSVAALVVAVVVFGIIIANYLSSDKSQQEVQTSVRSQTPQERLVAVLDASPDVSVSVDQKNRAVNELKKSRATLSNSQKSDIISSLQER